MENWGRFQKLRNYITNKENKKFQFQWQEEASSEKDITYNNN